MQDALKIEVEKSQRNETIVFFVDPGEGENPTETYEAIGVDNDELTRSLNNEVESKTNVLGQATVDITKGPNTTTVDPCYYRKNGKLAKKLKDIYWYDKELSQVVEKFMEVDATEEPTSGAYPAFQQNGAIDLKSWGGDTKGIGTPYDINWVGAKTYGTFNPTTKKFTENASV